MPALLERTSRLALDLLFPPQCAICRASGSVFCEYCVAVLRLAEGPRCERCWDDLKRGSLCHHCTEAPPAFTSVRAPFAFDDTSRQLVHLLKYQGLTSLAEPMGGLMSGRLPEGRIDLIVPVPLHPRRQRSRGYNQSLLLARQIARETGIPLDPRAARRVRPTKPLAQSMDRHERRTIVHGAFAADLTRVADRSILLVDDVVTTGATLQACSLALLEAGASAIHAVAFVRA
jgi:ComF family protein